MRCLVIGATGMLGQAVVRAANVRGLHCTGLARSGADISADVTDDASLSEAIIEANPDLIINAAACVDLQKCELDEAWAYRINARAVGVLANICRERSIQLVHISTDHFFTGDGARVHDENAPVKLVNAYARTKFAGEAFAATCPEALVVRTNITGARGLASRATFIEWVVSALRSGERIDAFTDFYTSTIDTRSFCTALFDVLDTGAHGILNLASSEVSDKKTFITSIARRLGVASPDIHEASVSTLTPARGESLGLDVTRAQKLLGRALPGVSEVVAALTEELEIKL